MIRSLLFTLSLAACAASFAGEPAMPDAVALRAMSARFAPVDVIVDLSALPAREVQALTHLIRAAEVVDALFLDQVWAGNQALMMRLATDPSPLGREQFDYFMLNKGPWSRLDSMAPFIPGVGDKPEGANFYAPDASRADVEAWVQSLPEPGRAAAAGFFTTLRRGPDGRLMAVPYSVEYQPQLAEMARHLRAAAAVTGDATLRDFLSTRAAALTSNDYYASDVAWMKLDAAVEPTLGPYEVYEDEWFNYKAAFEAFIALRDDAETAKLSRFEGELQWLEDRLPIDPAYRRASLGGLSPIRVVNVVFAAGDGNRGVQTAAFNLPNDERVVTEMGSKRVMLKNFQRAKFDRVLVPIAQVALAPEDRRYVEFDAFFTHILMHELVHGLGPKNRGEGGTGPTVRSEMKELRGTIEEAKADVSGLWALQQLIEKGVLDRGQERAMYTTFLASSFRTLRFGMAEAHARGMALQVNYLLDAGAFKVNGDGTFSVDLDTAKRATRDLTRDLLTLQAEGSYAQTKALLEKMAVIRPEVAAVIARLDDVPVDIRPRFVTAERLLAAGD